MLKKKGRVWYYAEDPVKKVADRPHFIAIALGLVAPTIAIVALFVSLTSLETSRRALEIGQRAYLSFEVQMLTVDSEPQAIIRQIPDELERRGKFKAYNFGTSVKVKNLGNTPAYLLRGTQQSSRFRKSGYFGFRYFGEGHQYMDALQETAIAGKAELTLSYDGDILEEDAHSGTFLEYGGHVVFRDVFSYEHTEKWCSQFHLDKPKPSTPLTLSPEICSPLWKDP